MLHNSPKSLLDSVSKIVKESKAKFEQEQRDLEEAQKALWEKKMGKKPLHPNQQKIDVVDDEKIDGKDFAKLRAMKKGVKTEEVEQVDEISSALATSYSNKRAAQHKPNLNSPETNNRDSKIAKGLRGAASREHGYGRDKAAENKVTGRFEYRKKVGTTHVFNKEEAEHIEEKKNTDTPGQHQCAVHVKNEQWGEGKTLFSQHAAPDAEGNIAWYDVMFEHGIEKQVPTSNLEILVSEAHKNHKKMAEEAGAVEEGIKDKVKASANAIFKAVTGGSDEDQRKDLQKKMGLPQTGKKPAVKEQAELDEARGRPRKNPSPEAGSEEEADQNIVMHLKKSVDTGGNHDVKFADKSTHKVPHKVASAVLGAMGKLKPADRLEVQKHIHQSHANLMQVHGMIK